METRHASHGMTIPWVRWQEPWHCQGQGKLSTGSRIRHLHPDSCNRQRSSDLMPCNQWSATAEGRHGRRSKTFISGAMVYLTWTQTQDAHSSHVMLENVSAESGSP
jgi:hypothetical protein